MTRNDIQAIYTVTLVIVHKYNVNNILIISFRITYKEVMTAILTENSHAKRDSPNYSIVWKRTCNIDPCSIHVHSCVVRYTGRGM